MAEELEDTEELSQLEATKQSILRLTDYDVSTLPRTDELGLKFSFKTAVSPARKIIEIFKRLPIQQLDELPTNELKTLESTADNFYNILESIEEFDPEGNSAATRDTIVEKIQQQRQPIFTKLYPLISYLTVRTTDFSELEAGARAAVQKAKKEAKSASRAVAQSATDAEEALKAIRGVAAEQGVSQQAIHFKSESDFHSDQSEIWSKNTIWVAIGLGVFAVLSLFLHKWSFLEPSSSYEAIQLGLSKILIFGVIGFMLVLSSKNFFAHKHNAVVNKHRQNALVTFKALVEAAESKEKQDIILDRASEAIFTGRDTGFSKSKSNVSNGASTILRMLPSNISE